MEPSEARIRISVACTPRQGEAIETVLDLAAGATAGDAIAASRFVERFPDVGSKALSIGIWGRPAGAETTLSAGDRVEIYRPLAVDPKEARRKRAAPRRPNR